MLLIRALLVILALVLLRRALGWVFDRWTSLSRGASERGGGEQQATRAGERTDALSDQAIDEADYEELH